MTPLGEALITARRASGLTQQQAAEAAGVTQAALSRYENDLRQPTDDALERLAAIYGVLPTVLHGAGRLRGAMAVDAHMRRRKTAKPTVWRQLEAKLNMYRAHSSLLFENISLHSDQRVPTFDPFETNPADGARMVRMQWGLPIGPVHHLFQWMEAAGCLVLEEDFGTTRVDGLSQWVGEHPIVFLNSELPTDRKRLTAAHELGHLVLHSTDIPDDVEADANAFAAEFLMPAETIRPQLRNLTDGKLHDLKREWGVSMQALIERAHGLGVLSTQQRTNLYKRFSSRGWRTREPLSDELRPEEPSLAREIGQSLIDSGLAREDIAAIAGFAADVARNPFDPAPRRLRAL